MKTDKQAIEEMARVIEITEQIARDAHCGYPSPRMTATDLYRHGYRKQSEVAREIFEEIEDILNNIGYFDEIDFKALKKKYVPDTNDGNIVKDPEHRCIYCQEIIPQGRDLCGMCEIGMDALNKYNKNNNQGG